MTRMTRLFKQAFFFGIVMLFTTNNFAQVHTEYLCIIDEFGNKVEVAEFITTVLPSGDVHAKFITNTAINDNSFGTNIVNWDREHKFSDLVGSDKAIFEIYDETGTMIMDFDLDYIGIEPDSISGYASHGIDDSGEKGDGELRSGEAIWLIDFNTSLTRNLNQLGYGSYTINSPVTVSNTSYTVVNSADENWIFEMIYEVTIAKEAFGDNGFVGLSTIQVPDLHNSPSKTDLKDVDIFNCEPPECEGEIGDRVWLDFSVAGAATNCDGIQDAGEPGIPNVTLELRDSTGSVIQTTSTDGFGFYKFLIEDLCEGNDDTPCIACEGKISELTLRYDGDVDNAHITVEAKKGDPKIVFDGYVNPGQDFSFVGTHHDGSFDNEIVIRIEGIRDDTKIHTSCSKNVFIGDVFGDFTVMDGASTEGGPLCDKPGGVVPTNKCYTVTVDESTLPDGYSASVIYQGSDPSKDSNSNPEEVCLNFQDNIDNTIDFGYCMPAPPNGATLGNRVWYDENENGIQDHGENGINNVVVNLYDCGDEFTVLETEATNSNGNYLFIDLEPGSYFVEFILPNGYQFTTQNANGSTAENDSDADESTGKTVCINLIADQIDLTWDAGMYLESGNDFDLTIEKTASVTNPDDGEIFTYTITVTNISSTDGTNISVSDLLPAGLIFQSASSPDYDNVSGIWDIGDVTAGGNATLNITVKVDYLSIGEAPIFDFGIAAPFNLFVLKDVVQPSSDTEGRVAVGRNATFTGYSIGDKLPLSGGSRDVLIVGRKLTFISGQVFSGNVVYGEYLDNQQINLCSDGTIRQDSVIDFAQAEVELNSLSAQLAARTTTGTTTLEGPYNIILTGTEPILNVFEIDGNDLSQRTSVEINVPNGSVVVVNISGSNLSWTGGLVVNGTGIGNVIYNFPEADMITIQGIDIQGSVLAPKAKVNFVAGVIHGQMICEYFEGQGQMNNSQFHGSIPGNPEITNCAEIKDYDQVDVDLSNNISCAPIVVNVDFDPNNGGNNNNENQWVEYGSDGIDEMIWSMLQSTSGMLVGTVGGNIYLSENGEFTLLNDGMDVVYIWSMYEFGGDLYVGTELGLYKTDASTLDENSVWTKVTLDGDVRSITSLNNVLYIAVWGDGVFSSSDGLSWIGLDKEGLEMCSYAVHTLTVANGELFAGTFGMGVLKYDFVFNLWNELPIGYPFVWSLATDENGAIYAGTYGHGAFVSSNSGENWYPINNGLLNKYIYSVSIYDSEVFISTWSSGVYKFDVGSLGKTNGEVTNDPINGIWSNLGMNGIEVSSIMVDEATNTLFAGTSSGTIYKIINNVTDVNQSETIPEAFALAQNYPNPFNPSTKIEFSIAEAGLYSVKIYDVLGQEVTVIANKEFVPGKYTFNFDASHLTSGVYFYKLFGEKVNITKKMLLLK